MFEVNHPFKRCIGPDLRICIYDWVNHLGPAIDDVCSPCSLGSIHSCNRSFHKKIYPTPRIALSVRSFVRWSGTKFAASYTHAPFIHACFRIKAQDHRYVHHTHMHHSQGTRNIDKCIIHYVHHSHVYQDTCIMDTCVMDTCIVDTCTMDTCIMDICIMDTCIMDTSAWVTWPERPKGANDKVKDA